MLSLRRFLTVFLRQNLNNGHKHVQSYFQELIFCRIDVEGVCNVAAKDGVQNHLALHVVALANFTFNPPQRRNENDPGGGLPGGLGGGDYGRSLFYMHVIDPRCHKHHRHLVGLRTGL